jgi:hypothetical protein
MEEPVSKYQQGRYRPENPKKYAGNPNDIIYRSGWELQLMKQFDTSESVVLWNSEGIVVPYRSPLDGEMHRYFPDFLIKVKDRGGVVKTWMIEVKPHGQTQLRGTKRNTRKFLSEVATFAVNQAKWAAADEFCKDQGWTFQVITEKHHSFL